MNAGTLKLLVHMYCHPPEVPFLFDGNPTFIRECRSVLFSLALIDCQDELAIITERGRAHVAALLDAPLPQKQWVSPIVNAVTFHVKPEVVT